MPAPSYEVIEPLTREARARRAATYVLRLCVAGMCVGYAYEMAAHGSDFGSALQTWGFNGIAPVTINLATAWALVVLAGLAFAMPDQLVGIVITALMVVMATAHMDFNRAAPYVELTPASRAARIAAPLVLGVLWTAGRKRRPPGVVMIWVLRIAASATFAAHGIEALQQKASFIALITGTFANVGIEVAPLNAALALKIIGAVDLIVAGLVLVAPWRPLVAWMAFWAFVAAFSRMTAHGWTWWYETAIRLPNGGVPLALLCLWWHRDKRESDTP